MMIMVMIMVMILVMVMVIMVHLLERLGRGATMAPGNSLSVTAVNKSSSIVTAKANSLWFFFAFGTIPSLLPFHSKYFQTEDALFRFCS